MSRPMPLVVFGIVFALCLALAAPGLTWLDGGELSLAAATMGVAHPPGEPVWLVFAKLATLLPLGDLPFRLTLLSATTVAGAAAVLAAVVADAAGRMTRIPGASVPLAGFVAGLAFGLAPATVLQGVRPELYGLAALLGVLSVRALQLGGRKGVALAVLPLALAGAVHHAMLVAAIPGLVLLASGRGGRSLRTGLVVAAVLLVPALGLYAWLPLRSFTDPAIDFGSPRTLERIVHHATAAGYARSFRADSAMVLANAAAHVRMLFADVGPVVPLAALVGAVHAWRRGRRRDVLAGLAIVVVGVLPTVLQGLFREDNPDARGYLLAVYAVVAAGAGLGTTAMLDRIRSRPANFAPWAGVVLLAGATLPGGLASMDVADHSARTLPSRLGAALLEDAPPGAIVLPGGDSWAFPALYLRYWEGRRADVHVHPLHMLEPSVLPSLRARGMNVPSRLTDHELQLLTTWAGLVPEATMKALYDRGVRMAVNEVWLPDVLHRARRERGLLYGIRAGTDAAAEDRLWGETVEPAAAEPGYADDPIGPGVLSRRYGARGGFWRTTPDPARAGVLWSRGSSIDPDTSAMIQLMRYRFNEGLEDGIYDPVASRAAAEGALLLQRGDRQGATAKAREALTIEPSHHYANLLAERLYSLGHHAAPPQAAP